MLVRRGHPEFSGIKHFHGLPHSFSCNLPCFSSFMFLLLTSGTSHLTWSYLIHLSILLLIHLAIISPVHIIHFPYIVSQTWPTHYMMFRFLCISLSRSFRLFHSNIHIIHQNPPTGLGLPSSCRFLCRGQTQAKFKIQIPNCKIQTPKSEFQTPSLHFLKKSANKTNA